VVDYEVRGHIIRNGDNSILFKTVDGVEVVLPREQIAVIREVEGVTIAMSIRLAKAKGLLGPDEYYQPKDHIDMEELYYGSIQPE